MKAPFLHRKGFAVDHASFRTMLRPPPMQLQLKVRYLRLVRSAFRTLRHRRLRHRPWWRSLTRPLFHRSLWRPCPATVSTAFSIGLFLAMMPIPFQSLAAALLCLRFRANVPFAMLACWVTNPLTQPPVILAQFRLGEWMRDTLSVPMPGFLTKVDYTIPGVGSLNAASFTLGFITSGIVLALLAYPIVQLIYKLLPASMRVRRPHVAPPATPTDTGFVP
jgi:uncharacterized protein (DUF2062 family)